MEAMIMKVIGDAFVIFATAAAGMLVAWLQKKLGVEGMKRVQAELTAKQELAYLAVQFVEQVYKDFDGARKYDRAAEWLATQARARGLQVTPEETKGMIEATIRAMKDEFGDRWVATVKPQV